jgi:hypothetical protein
MKTQQQPQYKFPLSLTLATATAPARTRPWILSFLLSFVLTVVIAYVLMELLHLRFCQPFRMEHMRKVFFFQHEVRHPAVVYLGTSQIQYGVMPPVVESEAARQGQPVGKGYNLAVLGADFELSWILARVTLKGDQRPEVLVLGIWPLVMAENGSGQTDFVCAYGNLADVYRQVELGRVPPTDLVSTSFRGVANLLQYPFRSLRRPLAVYRDEHLKAGQGSWWLPDQVAGAFPLPADRWQAALDKLSGDRDLSFSDQTRPAWMLRSIRDVAREREIRLVVVTPPQHPDYPPCAYRSGSVERYQAWITDFCRREGIDYVDLDVPGIVDHEDFLDPLHLNARGADKFSRRLTEVVSKAYGDRARTRKGS